MDAILALAVAIMGCRREKYGNSTVTQALKDRSETKLYPDSRAQVSVRNCQELSTKKLKEKNVISIRLNPDYVLDSNFIRHIGPQAHKLFKFIVTASNSESKTSQ